MTERPNHIVGDGEWEVSAEEYTSTRNCVPNWPKSVNFDIKRLK